MIGVESGQHLLKTAPIQLAARHKRPDRRRLQRLAVIHAVSGERQIAKPLTFIELDHLRRDPLSVSKVRKLRRPVISLCVQQADELQQLWVAGAVIKPDNNQRVVLPAELAPVT